MRKFNASAFYDAVLRLKKGRDTVEHHEQYNSAEWQKNNMSVPNRRLTIREVEKLHESLEILGMKVTDFATCSLLQCLKDKKSTYTFVQFSERMKDIENRLRDELSLSTVYVVKQEKVKYLESAASLFGQTVSDNFPGAISDIEDAGKCLAVEQGTACVFHLMRVMEVALRVLAKSLKVPYAPSWESYLRKITDQMALKHASKSKVWKRNEPFYRDLCGDLQAIKIAWRNPTMHIARRYQPDEAEEVFVAVRGFMTRVSTRLKQ